VLTSPIQHRNIHPPPHPLWPHPRTRETKAMSDTIKQTNVEKGGEGGGFYKASDLADAPTGSKPKQGWQKVIIQ